jgi:hypothetical protein
MERSVLFPSGVVLCVLIGAAFAGCGAKEGSLAAPDAGAGVDASAGSGGAAGSGGGTMGGAAGSGGGTMGGAAGDGGSTTGGSAGEGGSETGGTSGEGGTATGGSAGDGGTTGEGGTSGDGGSGGTSGAAGSGGGSGAAGTDGGLQCDAGTPCSGVCVDTANDVNNCGACAAVCSGSKPDCAAGTCVACLDGASRECYEGTSATKDVGECKHGTQVCAINVWPSGCPGQVLPLAQDLCSGKDNDCDGTVNTTPPCTCQNAATQNCGPCNDGTQTCTSGAWGACTGASTIGAACGQCGGVTQCGGSCSVATPANYGKSCGSCGGVTNCANTCTIPTPANLGKSCNVCTGVYTCSGTCSPGMPSCYGQTCNNGQKGACLQTGTKNCGCGCDTPTVQPADTFHNTKAANGSWDWNCNGTIEYSLTFVSSCASITNYSTCNSYSQGTSPACGSAYPSCFFDGYSCTTSTTLFLPVLCK